MGVETSDEVNVEITTLYSITHLRGARKFRDDALEIESAYRDAAQVPQHEKNDHRIFATNCILSTISFLEAYAKEFVYKCEQDVENWGKPVVLPELAQKPKEMVVDEDNLANRLNRASPPVNFNVLLDVMGLEEFEREEKPLEALLLLNRVRNKLIHYEPERVQSGPKQYTENEFGFEEELRNRFELNPLAAEGDSFFPDQCLSASCLQWATRNARSLVYLFSEKVGFELHQYI